jgi:hypothetical protein
MSWEPIGTLVMVVAVWFALTRWVLPRFGVPT